MVKQMILGSIFLCTSSLGFSKELKKVEIENGTLYFNSEYSPDLIEDYARNFDQNFTIWLKKNNLNLKAGYDCVPICNEHFGFPLGKPLVDEPFVDYRMAEQEGNVHEEETGHRDWVIWCGHYE